MDPGKFEDAILKNSESADFAVAAKEWRIYEPSEKELRGKFHCVCGKPIHLRYGIQNRLNDNTLIVGSECIMRMGSTRLTRKVRARITDVRLDGYRRVCHACCDLTLVSKEDWATICMDCYKAGERTACPTYLRVHGIACKDCEELFIPKFKGSENCYDCYKKSKGNAKECPRCGEKNILPGQESKAMCSKCSTSEECMRKCENCNRKLIYGNSPETIKICDKCFERGFDCQECKDPFKPKWKDQVKCIKCRRKPLDCEQCGKSFKFVGERDGNSNIICKDCLEEMTEFNRECFQCGEKTILAHEPEGKIKCDNCLGVNEKRKCKTCGEINISGKAPKSAKECYGCANKSKGGKQCATEGCKNPAKMKHCYECWKKNNNK